MSDALPGLRRLRLFAAEHGAAAGAVVAVAALVVLAVAGVGMAAPTERVEEERDPRTLTTTHAVNATVERSVAPYRAGQSLRDEPRYLFAATPNVTVTSTTRLPADGAARARLALSYVVRGGADERLWSTNRTLASTRGSETVRLTETLNASAVRDRARTLARNFGAGTTVEVAVTTVVDYETGPHEGDYRVRSEVAFPNARSYAVAPAERSVTRTETVTTTRVDRDRTLGGTGVSPARAGVGAAGLALLAGAGWLVRGARRFDAAEERRRLHAARYSVYITSVEGPLDYGWPDEFVASLEALADYAIDTNNQILECRRTGVYLVRDDDRTLVYDPRVEGWNVASMTPPAPGTPPVDGEASGPTPDLDPADSAGAFGFDPDVAPGDAPDRPGDEE